MKPKTECIEYLKKHHFLRNYDVEPFLHRSKNQIDLSAHICYCVGIIEDIRFVQAIRLLHKTPLTGITSYFIEWFHCQNNEESVQFWVHSGVTLRKHFFLFEDRISFIRGTFIYDEVLKRYYRLSSLLPFSYISEMSPPCEFIYATPIKKYHFKKKKSTQTHLVCKNKRLLQSHTQRFIRVNNINNYLEKEYPILFHEMKKIIST